MSGHSRGPWKASKRDSEGFYRVVDATEAPVAEVVAHWDNGDANALLIAAAPEMLAILRDIVEAASQRRELDVTRMAVALSSRARDIVDRIDKAGT